MNYEKLYKIDRPKCDYVVLRGVHENETYHLAIYAPAKKVKKAALLAVFEELVTYLGLEMEE